MRILEPDSDRAYSKVTLYLTSAEAAELRDSLDELLGGAQDAHAHVSSEDFKKEVTVCLYSPDDSSALRHLDERSRRIILRDE
jgi:hypothetical protein